MFLQRIRRPLLKISEEFSGLEGVFSRQFVKNPWQFLCKVGQHTSRSCKVFIFFFFFFFLCKEFFKITFLLMKFVHLNFFFLVLRNARRVRV